MSKTLLAVDDEQSILMIIDFVFGKKDYQVVQKTNGKEALNYMHQGNIPDVIIADLNMPEMNGLEFIHQVRASGYFREIPLIMLSGNEDTSEKIKCLKAGADDYLIKPFNPEELEARIDNLFRRISYQN